MAAVYNVPVGGALFALEVLLGQLSLPLVLPALLISAIAVATSYLFLPNLPTYDLPGYPFAPGLLAGGLVLGVLAGFSSILFVKAIGWADTRKPKGFWIILTPLLVFAGLGLASIVYPQLLGNGKNVVQLTFLDQLSFPLLALLLLPRALATVACLGSGTPGGLFTPTMTVGALLGGLFGHLWSQVCPGPAAVYAIFGAAAILAASTKGPISALVLTFELINHITILAVPLVLTVAVATLVGRVFEARSIYSARIHLGKSVVAKINHDRVISAAAPYAEVLQRLLHFRQEDMPLYAVDEEGALVGKISARHALAAETFAHPLQAASADDLAVEAKALPASATPAQMEERLRAEHLEEMPIVKEGSGRFRGIYRKRATD
jgi:H+/Cl- antiporter ClcA